MNKMDLRLYEFDAAFQALQNLIEENIDMDTGEYVGVIPIEELIQQQVNMEQSREAKLLSLGKLILHYNKMGDVHDELAAKHKKKANSAFKAADILKNYIKACTPAGFKLKDAEVSIYETNPARVQPTKPVDECPPAYRRPSLVKNYSRDVADRIQKSCVKQGLPVPFEWEHDKEAMKAAIKDCEANGTQFDLAVLEKNRAVVVR